MQLQPRGPKDKGILCWALKLWKPGKNLRVYIYILKKLMKKIPVPPVCMAPDQYHLLETSFHLALQGFCPSPLQGEKKKQSEELKVKLSQSQNNISQGADSPARATL